MEWVLGHMEDADFNEPLPAPSSSAAAPAHQPASSKPVDPEQAAMLGAMGFTPEQVNPAFPEEAYSADNPGMLACTTPCSGAAVGTIDP